LGTQLGEGKQLEPAHMQHCRKVKATAVVWCWQIS